MTTKNQQDEARVRADLHAVATRMRLFSKPPTAAEWRSVAAALRDAGTAARRIAGRLFEAEADASPFEPDYDDSGPRTVAR